MSSFITETIEDLPSVLLISPPGPIQAELESFLRHKKLNVVIFPHKSGVEESRENIQEILASQSWYKIVWVAGEFFQVERKKETWLELLQPYEQKLVVLGSVVTPIDNSTSFTEWSAFTTAQTDFLSRLSLSLPHSSLIAGLNVFGSQDVSVLSLWYHQSQNLLINPELELSLLSVESFIKKSSEFLISPRPKKILVTGEKFSSLEVVTKAQEVLDQAGLHLEILSFPVSSATFQLNFKEQSVKESKKEQLLTRFIELVKNSVVNPEVVQSQHTQLRETSLVNKENSVDQEIVGGWENNSLEEVVSTEPALPQPSYYPPQPVSQPPGIKQPQPVSLAEELGVLERSIKENIVVPIFKPHVENRLKKYEQRIEGITRRKTLSARLANQKKKSQLSDFQHPQLKPIQKKVELQLDQEIQHIFGLERAQQKVVRVKTQTEKTIQHQEKKKRQSVALVIGVVVATVVVFCASLSAVFLITQQRLLSDLIAFSQAENKISMNETQVRAKELDSLANFFSFQVDSSSLLLGKDFLSTSSKLAAISKEVAEVVTLSQDSHQLTLQMIDQFFGRNSTSVFNTTLSLSEKTQTLYQKLSLIQTQIESYEQDKYGDAHVSELDDLTSSVQDKRKTAATLQQFQQLLPGILAQNGRKTFLIILQNNQELRPTGGLIQSVALVTIDKGVMVDYQVMDTTTIDNALKGVVNPPDEVKNYLGQNQWYLRDANWDPNFPTSAQQIEWFVEKSIGKKTDGVIALNLLTLKDMIHSLGPLTVPGYNEVVTDQNVLDKIEFHSEIKLVQGAQEDFVTVLFGKILNEISVASSEKVSSVMENVYTALHQGQMFVFLNDQSENSILSSLSWSGEMASPKCPVQFGEVPCVVDTSMQVESNVGINKANFYLERSIQEKIEVLPDRINHERTIIFKNTAPSNAWPLGSYKNYMRLYVPDQSTLLSYEVDDVAVPGTQVTIAEEDGKKYFGSFVEIPIQRTVKVVIRYTEPFSQKTPFAYTYFDQKQAGTPDDPLQITLIPDSSFHPILIAPQATVNGSSVIFSGVRDKHTFVGVKFN